MEIGSLAKWVDELAGELQKIRQRSNKLPDFSITNPEDGQGIIYDAESGSWINGSVGPAPEPPVTRYALIEQTDGKAAIVNPLDIINDGVSTIIDDPSLGQFPRLKSSAGTYKSFFRSIDAIDLTDIDTISYTYTAIGETRTATADVSSYKGKYHIGGMFLATYSYFEVGVALFPLNTPQFPSEFIVALHDPAAAGNIDFYSFIAEKSDANTRKKTIKKK